MGEGTSDAGGLSPPYSSSSSSSSQSGTPNEVLWSDLNHSRFYTLMPACHLTVRGIIFPLQLLKTHSQTVAMKMDSDSRSHPSLKQTAVDLYSNRYQSLSSKRAAANPTLSSTNRPTISLPPRIAALSAFYKGFGTSMLGLISGPIYATVFELTRHKLMSSEDLSTPVASGISGMAAGICVQLIQVPIDLIAQRRMVLFNEQSQAPSPLRMFQEIVERDGVLSLWRGVSVGLLSYLPTSATVWTVNVGIKEMLKNRELSSLQWSLVTLISGGLGGSCAALLTMPFDVVRTRKQVLDSSKDQRIPHIFSEVVRNYGIRGLYRGLPQRMTSMTISSGIIMAFYDALKRVSQ